MICLALHDQNNYLRGVIRACQTHLGPLPALRHQGYDGPGSHGDLQKFQWQQFRCELFDADGYFVVCVESLESVESASLQQQGAQLLSFGAWPQRNHQVSVVTTRFL